MAAAALLWDSLLTPQRRASFFYAEVAALHPFGGGNTIDRATSSTAAADAVKLVTVVEPASQEARSPQRLNSSVGLVSGCASTVPGIFSPMLQCTWRQASAASAGEAAVSVVTILQAAVTSICPGHRGWCRH